MPGYVATWELLDFERGVLVASTEKHNGVSDNPNAPEAYGVKCLPCFREVVRKRGQGA